MTIAQKKITGHGRTWWSQNEISPKWNKTKSNSYFREPSLYIPKIHFVPRRVEALHAAGFRAKTAKWLSMGLNFCPFLAIKLIKLPIILKLATSEWLSLSTYMDIQIFSTDSRSLTLARNLLPPLPAPCSWMCIPLSKWFIVICKPYNPWSFHDLIGEVPYVYITGSRSHFPKWSAPQSTWEFAAGASQFHRAIE